MHAMFCKPNLSRTCSDLQLNEEEQKHTVHLHYIDNETQEK